MERRLGTLSIFGFCTGAMFSSGFFLLPGMAAAESGPLLPLVYLCSGLLLLPAILSIAELSSAIPRAGGPYLFVNRSLGPLAGLIAAVGNYLQLLLKGAFAFVGFGAYLTLVLDIPIQPVALGLIVLFTALNLIGIKQTALTEIVLVAILLLVLTYLVISGVVQYPATGRGLRASFQPLLPYGFHGLFTAMALIFVSFGGIGQVASLAEEVRNPARAIPRGMLLSLAVATGFYVLGTALMVLLLEPTEFRADQVPVATMAAALERLPLPAWVVVIMALAAFASTGNAAILSAARYPVALTREKLLWNVVGKLDSRGVPRNAVLLTGLVLTLLVLTLEVKSIARLASAFLLFVFLGLCLAVVVFRESRIDEYHPRYRAPGYPWVQCLGVAAYLVLIIESGLQALGLLAGLCLLASVWYHFGVRERSRYTPAILPLLGRLGEVLACYRPHATGAPAPGNLDLAQLAERAIVLDVEEATDLSSTVGQVAQELEQHLGGKRASLADSLKDEISHWKSPLRTNVVFSSALLQEIEQPEMVILRGQVKVSGQKYQGLILLLDDELKAGRMMRLLSELEHRVRNAAFAKNWQAAQTPQELRDVFRNSLNQ